MTRRASRTPRQIAAQLEAKQRERLVIAERREKARVEAVALAERMDETYRQAEARGEAPERLNTGALRIVERDPLLSLIRAGKLTPDEFDVGIDFQELYARQAQDAGALQYGDTAGGGHDNDRYVFTRLQRAKITTQISKAEVDISFGCRDEPMAIVMFKGVVGQRKPVSSFGKGRAFDRNVVALKRALGVAGGLVDGKKPGRGDPSQGR